MEKTNLSRNEGKLVNPIIDAHIHLDKYSKNQQQQIISEMTEYGIESLVTVSSDLSSAKANLKLHRAYNQIKPAFGFHPEQPVLDKEEMETLCAFVGLYHQEMIAIGEVGLPYYTRKENPDLQIEPYINVLDQFMMLAKQLRKPIVLHAIYEDAAIACDLLEKNKIDQAHFHWFKGDTQTVERMIQSGYFISITPDVVYEEEIQELVKRYPLAQLMVETDGPWAFTGPFDKKMTHPKMIHQVIETIASIKKVATSHAYEQLLGNTKRFYMI